MTEPTRPCGTCGMPCTPGEYHPYAACLMFQACHNSETVRANLEAVRGTPPAVAGEPFCYVSVNKQGDITRTMKRKDKWTNIPLYTTPQPTQAQAGAVPLTDEQLPLLRFATSSLFHLFERWNNKEIPHYQLMDEMGQVVEHVIRRTVAAHGIKGGQHGAEH